MSLVNGLEFPPAAGPEKYKHRIQKFSRPLAPANSRRVSPQASLPCSEPIEKTRNRDHSASSVIEKVIRSTLRDSPAEFIPMNAMLHSFGVGVRQLLGKPSPRPTTLSTLPSFAQASCHWRGAIKPQESAPSDGGKRVIVAVVVKQFSFSGVVSKHNLR